MQRENGARYWAALLSAWMVGLVPSVYDILDIPEPPPAIEQPAEEPAAPPEPIIEEPAEEPIINERLVWDNLADCESGNWINGGSSFETGSARWDWAKPGTTVPPWGTTIHHGGLQFHPKTWDWVAPMVGLGHIDYAYNATREQQIEVGKKTKELQGWGAWPVCSKKLGLR